MIAAGVEVLVVDRRTTLAAAAAVRARLSASARVELVCASDPVTDTVKTVREGRVTGTVDREQLARLRAPMAMTAATARELGPPPLDQLAGWSQGLRARAAVALLP